MCCTFHVHLLCHSILFSLTASFTVFNVWSFLWTVFFFNLIALYKKGNVVPKQTEWYFFGPGKNKWHHHKACVCMDFQKSPSSCKFSSCRTWSQISLLALYCSYPILPWNSWGRLVTGLVYTRWFAFKIVCNWLFVVLILNREWLLLPGCNMKCSCYITGTIIIYSVHNHDFESP